MKMKVALAAFAVVTSIALTGSPTVAGDLQYSELENRLIQFENQFGSENAIQQITYFGDCASCGGCGDAGCCCESSCCDCCSTDCCSSCNCCSCGSRGGIYAEVQMNFIRGHVLEGSIIADSKLSEEYELSPRFILGAENCFGQGARARYWHYGHQHNNIAGPSGVRFEMDVLDLEATYRFSGCRTDVVVAGGFRAADVGVRYTIWDVQTDLIGLTAATDVRTVLCCNGGSETAFVYGGRLAILAGDIDGGPQGLIRDENWRVWELYVGVEQRCCLGGIELYTRLAFEMQNWHADQMPAETGPPPARDTSLGFVGPGFHFGAAY